MGISRQDVWRAADELAAGAQKVTLATVRKALGGGSFTTISEAMGEWHARRAAANAPRVDPAPERVLAAAGEFAQQVWSTAAELAGARLQSEREALEAARLQFAEDQAQAAAFADQLGADLETAHRRVAELEGELEQTRQAHRAQRDSLTAARDAERARADRAEATADERSRHVASLEGELVRVRADKDQELARLAGLLAQFQDRGKAL